MIRNNKKKKKEKNYYTPCSWFVLVSGIDLVFMILRMDNSSISCSFATCWSIPDREVTLTPISLANYTPYSYAFASISIAPKGVFIFLLKAAITNPWASLMITPTLALFCVAKTAPSTFTLNNGLGGFHQPSDVSVWIVLCKLATLYSSKFRPLEFIDIIHS